MSWPSIVRTVIAMASVAMGGRGADAQTLNSMMDVSNVVVSLSGMDEGSMTEHNIVLPWLVRSWAVLIKIP